MIYSSPAYTLLDAAALQPSDAPAIIYLETGQPPITLSRAAFSLQVNQIAAALRQLGIQPGDLVIIAHTQNLESITAFWGAMVAGAIPSMFPTLTEKLDPVIYQRNMADLVALSGVKGILTTDEFAAALQPVVGCPVWGSGQLAVGGEPLAVSRDNLKLEPRNSKLETSPIAFLQHSSGTTGLQKGVALSHQAVLNQISSYSQAIGLNEQDVIVSWLPLYHDMGLIAGFILPLVTGIPLVLMSPFDWVQHPALLFRAIHDYQGTLCWLPNFAYNHCARRIRQRDIEGVSLASMRLFINCSEPVRHESHRLFLERFADYGVRGEMLGVSYAMAENTFAVTQTSPDAAAPLDTVDQLELTQNHRALPVPGSHPHALTLVSCGHPIQGTEIKVVDERGRALPDRQVGEIALRSDCMLSEYYRRPDLQPFQDGWYFTGDMGYITNGELYVMGRQKDLIINAGKNIYPQDIEAIVNSVPGVHPGRAVVFGVPDEREGTELVAVIAEVTTDDPEERKRINKAIRQDVARQSMVTLSYVHLVGARWLIKTSSGKIARAANRDKWLEERGNH
ncbi:MAG: AMP-binding protein [Anaerolineae bacterium]|nr:AMP-binding protein [Anaerolineae bacterium]